MGNNVATKDAPYGSIVLLGSADDESNQWDDIDNKTGGGEKTPEVVGKVKPPRSPRSKATPKQVNSVVDNVYLQLDSDGKYKELTELELHTAGATAVNDPSIRLVKGKILKPRINFDNLDD